MELSPLSLLGKGLWPTHCNCSLTSINSWVTFYYLTKDAIIFMQETYYNSPFLQYTINVWSTYTSKTEIHKHWEKKCLGLMHDQKTTAEIKLITALKFIMHISQCKKRIPYVRVHVLSVALHVCLWPPINTHISGIFITLHKSSEEDLLLEADKLFQFPITMIHNNASVNSPHP
jgi:hypothetical protein